MLVNQIRSSFVDFFRDNNHYIAPSSSLVPNDDPTLLFVNSGMVQFKNYFTNVATPPNRRIASAQKCVRAGGKHNDLDNVGYTARHHTFFEMLGNFSFGDYFKEEAISYAWHFLTKTLQIPKDKLYVTVYHTDDEAVALWKKIAGLSDSRIIKISTSDNFWQMGDTGPCGPCSEIFYDHGDKIFGGLPGTADQDGDRYIEIWNLVFTQYDLQLDGSKLILPQKCIDTGAGLERLSSVMQGKTNNYDIDLFQNIMNESKDLTKTGDSPAHRVIADHLRTACFLIADGVMPSNEGRGYVMRRIMRRAMRYVHQLGYQDALMHKLVPSLVREMGEAYPELKRAESAMISTLRLEEERFKETLGRGMRLLEQSISSLSAGGTLSGEVAFKLYDTYGFPLDLTKDVLRNRDIGVNEAEFDEAMLHQKQLAKAAWVGSGDNASAELWFELYDKLGATEFLGYQSSQASCEVKAIIVDGKEVQSASAGSAWVILNQTPFYAESGGQVGDIGHINAHEVKDVKKQAGALFCHLVELNSELKRGDFVKASIDQENRRLIQANHSSAHLLQAALRKVLGDHVNQKGSLVSADKVRFDFSHPQALQAAQLEEIELLVNTMIMNNSGAETAIMSPEAAIKEGAIALFGEKYGDEVRVMKMGESVELCGGTHVASTGDIGLFKIISEEAIAAGVRRIEAQTGLKALQFMNGKQKLLNQCLAMFKCQDADLVGKIDSLQADRKELEKQNSSLRISSIVNSSVPYEEVDGDKFIKLSIEFFPVADLRALANAMLQKNGPGVVILASLQGDKTSVVIQTSKELMGKWPANSLLKKMEALWPLKGGGNAESVQAGSAQPIHLDKLNCKDLV